jgi:hypothetical protein
MLNTKGGLLIMLQGLIGRKSKLMTVCVCMLCIMFLSLGMSAPANATNTLAGWNWRIPLPTGNNLYGVSYGNSTFVAVGGGGTILTSPDGATWTSRSSGTTNDLGGVSYGNSAFVAVGGGGTVLTSPDGATWTSQRSGTTNDLGGVNYGNTTFVAVGGGGTVLTSPDGATWTSQRSGTTNDLYGISYGNSTFVAVGQSGTVLQSGTTNKFSDVSATYWGYDAISSLSSEGIVSGYPDGTFKPNAAITRAEFAAMLVQALGLNTSGTTGTFTDVTADSWYYGTVNSAVYAGLVSGMGYNLFSPETLITREQMAVMVAKALGDNAPATDGTELNAFGDSSSVSSWAVTSMEEAVKAGIVSGMTADRLAPLAHATRAQAAAMLYKLLTVTGK